MPLMTVIARANDGLRLCESYDQRAREYSRQVDAILSDIRRKAIRPSKCTVSTVKNMCFHYVIDDEVVFITLAQEAGDKRLAFGFLEDIRANFKAYLEVETERGGSLEKLGKGAFRDIISKVDIPYACIGFDSTLDKKRRQYSNPSSNESMNILKGELTDITNIMRSNIDDLLRRGDALEDLHERGRNLRDGSKAFQKEAKWLRMMKELQQYILVGVVVLIVLFVLYMRFM